MQNGTCGENLTWTLFEDTLIISGTGDMENYSLFEPAPWPRMLVERILITDGVTTLGDEAFKNCMVLREISIPDTVKRIGNESFNCCTSLGEVIIPESVTSIGNETFWCCDGLRDITIPNSVTSVGYGLFTMCTNLERIFYPEGADEEYTEKLSTGNNAELISYSPEVDDDSIDAGKLYWEFENGTLIVGGTKTIKIYAGENLPWYGVHDSVQSIVIENGVKEICENAFIDCALLDQVFLPESVKTIGDFAFKLCYCGNRAINSGRNVIWSLNNGVLLLKKNPVAKSEEDFSTGAATWQIADKNIREVQLESGVVPSAEFFDWLSGASDVKISL